MSLPTIRLARGDVAVEIVPDRGALVTSISVSGKELLYLDRATLEDPAKNVRGGIPILYPYAGKLSGGVLRATGAAMGQHGFGRNRPWSVEERGADHARLRLIPDEITRAAFPFDVEVDSVVRVLPRGVESTLRVRNLGALTVPLSPGWHPYFRCPSGAKGRVTGDVAGFSADRLGDDREFDFGLPAPASGEARFELPGVGALRLQFSPSMRHMQFWSLPGKDFICLEPFFGPPDTINTAARLEVAAGGLEALSMRIEYDAPAPTAGP